MLESIIGRSVFALLIATCLPFCTALSVIEDYELSVPLQNQGERDRFLQMNLVAGSNDSALINVGGYNESGAAMLNLGAVNASMFSGFAIGLWNTSMFSGFSLGGWNHSAGALMQLGGVNTGFAFVSAGIVNYGGGFQLGLYNSADAGIQVGLLNRCADLTLPLVNYCDGYSTDEDVDSGVY